MLTPIRSEEETAAEAALVGRAKSGPDGFVELYDRYFQRIYNYVFYRVARHQDAEDIVSDVFFKALTGIRDFEWRRQSIGAWLYRIAANSVADHYRKARRTPVLLAADSPESRAGPSEGGAFEADRPVADPAEEAERRLEHAEAMAAIGSLPADQQDAIVLRYVQDLDVRDIAVILNRSEGAVRALISRGLRETRERLTRAAGANGRPGGRDAAKGGGRRG